MVQADTRAATEALTKPARRALWQLQCGTLEPAALVDLPDDERARVRGAYNSWRLAREAPRASETTPVIIADFTGLADFYDHNQNRLSQEELSIIAADLPNVPPEVIESWLGDFVRLHGWPPQFDASGQACGGWRGVFAGPLRGYRRVRWELTESALAFKDFNPVSPDDCRSDRQDVRGRTLRGPPHPPDSLGPAAAGRAPRLLPRE